MLIVFFFGTAIAVGISTAVSSAGLKDDSNNANETIVAVVEDLHKETPGSQPSQKKENTEAIVTDSNNQSQDTQDILIAYKERASMIQCLLRETEEDLSMALQRSENAETKVVELSEPKQSWTLFGNRKEPSKQTSKKNGNAEAVVANLKKQLKDTQQKLDASKMNHKTTVANLKKKLQETQDNLCAFQANASEVESHLRTTNAELQKTLDRVEKERDRLVQMMSGATIPRGIPSPKGSFPDGDQITKMARATGSLAWDYLQYTSYHLKINPLQAAKSGLWRAVDFAEGAVKACVEEKTKHLTEFIEGEIPPEESLGHLFWKSTMQHVMKQKLDKPYDSFFAEWVSSDEQLKAIVDMDEKHKDELEGRNIGAFMELHFKLRLACRFSDPECFLWPAVGTTVAFSSKHHNQQKTPERSKRKAKAGESVHVVYPGLYFRHPEEPDCQPVVRAMVAVL